MQGQKDEFMSQWNKMESFKYNPSVVGAKGVGEIYNAMREYQDAAGDKYDLQSDFIYSDARQVDIKIST